MSVHTRIAIVSSCLTSFSAPTSSQVTSGIVAKPSLLADGWTVDNAALKRKKTNLTFQVVITMQY